MEDTNETTIMQVMEHYKSLENDILSDLNLMKQKHIDLEKKIFELANTNKMLYLLLPKILLLSSDHGIGQSSVREIDKLGIRVATELSMLRALKKLKEKPSELLIDGPLLLRPWNGIQKNIEKLTKIGQTQRTWDENLCTRNNIWLRTCSKVERALKLRKH